VTVRVPGTRDVFTWRIRALGRATSSVRSRAGFLRDAAIIEADRPPGVFYGLRGEPPVLHGSHCEVSKHDQAEKICFISDKQRTAARS
jgi:hypothetical protein